MLYYDNLEFNKDIDYEIYLINKQLKKHYTEDESKIIIKQSINQLDKVAITLAKEDIGFFCLYFLPYFFVPNSNSKIIRPLSKTHYEIFDELNNMFAKDKWDNEEFILPRNLGKSTVINKALACWSHCYRYSRYSVVIGKREEDAITFVGDTKQMLKSKKIVDNFGELVKPKERVVNKQELELDNNTKIVAVSSGTSIRGTTYGCSDGIFRPSIVIVDDFINENDILTDNAKEKIVNKYYKEIMEAGDKANYRNGKKISSASKFLVIGTPLSSDDFINTIRKDSEFRVFHRSVCDFDVDDYFANNKDWQVYRSILLNSKDENRVANAQLYYNEHIDTMQFERLWNDKWSCCYLANKYFTKRLTFMQELMCDCEKVGDVWIKYMAKLSAKEIEDKQYSKTLLSIDPSATNNNKADFSAFTVLSKTNNGFYCVREGELKKFDGKTEFDKYIAYVIDLLHKWQDITHVVLEKNVYKGVDATRIEEEIAKDKELSKRRIEVILIYNTINKDARISTICDKINSGQIIFNENDKQYNEQVFEFRGQKYTSHDDAIDSLEMAVNNIDKIKTTNKITLLDKSCLF